MSNQKTDKPSVVLAILLSTVVLCIILVAILYYNNRENFIDKPNKSSITTTAKNVQTTYVSNKNYSSIYTNLMKKANNNFKTKTRKNLPIAINKVTSILGKERLNAYKNGKPMIIRISLDYDLSFIDILKLIKQQKVDKGYYVVFVDTNKKQTKTANKDGDEDSQHGFTKEDDSYSYFNEFLFFITKDKLYTQYLDFSYIINNLARDDIYNLINIVNKPEFLRITDDVWKYGSSFAPRRTSVYNGSWEKRVIVEDAQNEALGNDFFGITAIGEGIGRTRYAIAGYDNRERLITVTKAENLGFGRFSTEWTMSNCPNSPLNQATWGQGCSIGFRTSANSGDIYSVFPVQCEDNNGTQLNFMIGSVAYPAVSPFYSINIKDENGNIINRTGFINHVFEWVAYDKSTRSILIPEAGSSPETFYLFRVEITNMTINVSKVKNIKIKQRESEAIPIVAASFGDDGFLYAITNNYSTGTFSSFQGIVVLRPNIITENNIIVWTLQEVSRISLDINDSLVGITQVTDPYLIGISNVPIFVVMERNDDYVTLDNLTLHEVIPRDAYEGRFIGVESEASEFTELAQETYCFGGIVAYNSGLLMNLTFATGEPITFENPSLLGVKRYFDDIGLGLEIALDEVEIYQNQCLASNYWKYEEGQRQNVRASSFGYNIFLRDYLVYPDGTVNGSFVNVLMHELIHTRQYVQHGESNYQHGCAYGEGDLYGGSYSQRPMEQEARRYVNRYKMTNNIAIEYGIPINRSREDPFANIRARTTCEAP